MGDELVALPPFSFAQGNAEGKSVMRAMVQQVSNMRMGATGF